MTEPPAAFRVTSPITGGKLDPFRFCIATTVSLIGLAITPALAVVIFSTFGIVSYVRARRAGLLKSRCLLGDTRLVLVYLSIAWIAGVVLTLDRLID